MSDANQMTPLETHAKNLVWIDARISESPTYDGFPSPLKERFSLVIESLLTHKRVLERHAPTSPMDWGYQMSKAERIAEIENECLISTDGETRRFACPECRAKIKAIESEVEG